MDLDNPHDYDSIINSFEFIKNQTLNLKLAREAQAVAENAGILNLSKTLVAMNSVFTFYFKKQINFIKIIDKVVNLLYRNVSINDAASIIFHTFYFPYLGKKVLLEFITHVALHIFSMKHAVPNEIIMLISNTQQVGQILYEESQMEMHVPTEIQPILVQLASNYSSLETPII